MKDHFDYCFYKGSLLCLIKGIVIFSLLLSASCSSSIDRKKNKPYIDIYYAMGYIDSDGPCESDFQDREVFDKGSISIDRDSFDVIVKLIDNLEVSDNNIPSTYGMCLQSNFHLNDSTHMTLSIGQFGDVSIDGNSFVRNNNLVYLLRKYSGFYNHYERDELIGFCKEVSTYGVPADYIFMKVDNDANNALYAKVRILVE